MIINAPQKISLSFFVIVVLLWLGLFISNTTAGFYNYLYSFLFGLIPLIGGMVAMWSSHQWGGLKTALGKAILFIGLGIFCWGSGEAVWSYYNFFLNVPAPYPSLADLFFAPSIFCYGLGAFHLFHVTGAKFGFRGKTAKISVLVGLCLVAGISYYVLVTLARHGVLIPDGDTFLKGILDVAYPVGDFLSLAVAVIVSGLSFSYLGGRYKPDIVAIMAGLAVMFVADSVFSYTTTVGTYYNGNWGDLLLAIGTFLLTFGVLGFYKIKEAKDPLHISSKI